MGRFLLVLLWLIYFFSPIDLIPDFIPGVGRLDDLILLIYLIYATMKKGSRHSPGSSGSTGTGYQSHEYGNQGDRPSEGAGPDQPRDPYTVLGLKRTATVEEIKRAYRTQAARYHPDKVTHLGEEFQELAKKKFQELHWAYETVLKEKKAL